MAEPSSVTHEQRLRGAYQLLAGMITPHMEPDDLERAVTQAILGANLLAHRFERQAARPRLPWRP